ncbi:MAG: DUF1800 domain-containing protein [Cyanobacteria bacterium J06632_22]
MDSSQKITHILDRLSFGPRPGDRQRVEQIGIESYIQQQLSTTGEPRSLTSQLNQRQTLALSPVQLYNRNAPPRNANQEQRRNARLRQVEISRQAEHARLLRAIESPNQLQEVMVDFWFNHFNVFVGKGLTRLWLGHYEQAAIRTHALGKFKTLLEATAKHPAMLFYLDNWRNTAPNSNNARGRFKGLNENYARELMELHTLGVDGGYTQADVESLARILTGWSIMNHDRQSPDGSGFVFMANRHDSSNKTLLGQPIAGGGVEEGEAALELLARHPSTAQHISYKLAQYFVADQPPASLVRQLADRFQATDGDISAVLSTLFASDEFWDTAYYQQKFKTPYQYVLSVARATGLNNPSEEKLNKIINAMGQMGMPLYRCQAPDGYAQVAEAWLSPDAMLRRVSLSVTYVNQNRENLPTFEQMIATLGNPFPPESRATITQSPPPMQPALILGSPEMMYR